MLSGGLEKIQLNLEIVCEIIICHFRGQIKINFYLHHFIYSTEYNKKITALQVIGQPKL